MRVVGDQTREVLLQRRHNAGVCTPSQPRCVESQVSALRASRKKRGHTPALKMFRNTFQSGFLSVLYAIGSKPLQIWSSKVRSRCGEASVLAAAREGPQQLSPGAPLTPHAPAPAPPLPIPPLSTGAQRPH